MMKLIKFILLCIMIIMSKSSKLNQKEKNAITKAAEELSSKNSPFLWAGFTKKFANNEIQKTLNLFNVANVLEYSKKKILKIKNFSGISGNDWKYLSDFFSKFVFNFAFDKIKTGKNIQHINIVLGPAVRVETNDNPSYLCKVELPIIRQLSLDKLSKGGITINLHCMTYGEYFKVSVNPYNENLNCQLLLDACSGKFSNSEAYEEKRFEKTYKDVQEKLDAFNEGDGKKLSNNQYVDGFNSILSNYEARGSKIKLVKLNSSPQKINEKRRKRLRKHK